MADYYPLLSRAIVNLGDAAGPDVRRAIYDRARTTLLTQLEKAEPPLPEDRIERERASLEAVIARLEMEARARAKPASQPPRRFVKELAERARDDAALDTPPVVSELAPEPAVSLDDGTGPDKPMEMRPSVEPPLARRRGMALPEINWRIAGLTVAAALVIGALAGLAYAFRDQVDAARREQAEQAAANPAPPLPSPDAKLTARLGAAPAPSETPAPAPDPGPQLAVSQRATLFIEVPGAADQVPRTVAGRVVWRFENLPSKPGQPLDPALVGTVEIPDAGMTMRFQMTRNRDSSLPASYLVGLVFTTKESSVKEIAPILMKTDESERGTPLAGIQQPLGPNLFVVALSNSDADIAKNIELLTKRGWVETQFRLADQRRGAIVFEKGLAGDRALLTAIDAWR